MRRKRRRPEATETFRSVPNPEGDRRRQKATAINRESNRKKSQWSGRMNRETRSEWTRRKVLATTLAIGVPLLSACDSTSLTPGSTDGVESTNAPPSKPNEPTKSEASLTVGTQSPSDLERIVPDGSSGYATLSGRFVLEGPPPPRRRLTVDADHEFCDQFEIYDESLVLENETPPSSPLPQKATRLPKDSNPSETDAPETTETTTETTRDSQTLPGIAHCFVFCRSRDLVPDPALTPQSNSTGILQSADTPDYSDPSGDSDVRLPQTVLLDNRDAIFKPHVLTLWVGHQTLRIVNSDPIAQNVAFAPPGDRTANLVLPPYLRDVSISSSRSESDTESDMESNTNSRTNSHTESVHQSESTSTASVAPEALWSFRRAQPLPIPVHCNYHSWELAYLLPHGNPYSTTSDRTGRFELSRLPVGDHTFFFFHERTGPLDFTLVLHGVRHRCERGKLEIRVPPEGMDLGTIRLPVSLFTTSFPRQ